MQSSFFYYGIILIMLSEVWNTLCDFKLQQTAIGSKILWSKTSSGMIEKSNNCNESVLRNKISSQSSIYLNI